MRIVTGGRLLGAVDMLSGARRCCAVLYVAAAILMTGIAGPAMSTTVSPPASERIANAAASALI